MRPLLGLLRWVVGIRSGLTREEALSRAKVHVERQGWPWEEPVVVSEGVTVFRIRTNTNFRGGNVNVGVKVSDGSIAFARFARR